MLSQPTVSCGDEYCDSNENSTICPSDCIDYSLETTYDYDSGTNGNMFVVKALSDVSITSLSINSMTRGVGAVKVYTRKGSYLGRERSEEGWTLIYDDPSTQLSRRGRTTKLDNFEVAMNLSGGDYQSFYVWAEQKLVYKRGKLERLPFASDESLVIFEGIGVKGHFGPIIYTPRVWGGTISYTTSVV